MSNKSPAFQFYAENFLNGTAHMTPSQVGIYIRLLCHQWHFSGLPNDDKRLMQMTGGKRPDLLVVREKFTVSEDGLLRNNRMEEARRAQEEFRKKASEAGKKSARLRQGALNEPTNDLPNQNATLQSSSSSALNTVSIEIGNRRFDGKTSEWLKLNKEAAIEVLMMKEYPNLDIDKVFEKLDNSTVSYHFKDDNHPYNYFKSLCEDMAKSKKKIVIDISEQRPKIKELS